MYYVQLPTEWMSRTREFQLYKDPLEAITMEHYSLHYLTKKEGKVITVFYCIISFPKSVELEGNLLLLCPYFVSVYSYSADFDCFSSNHQRIA